MDVANKKKTTEWETRRALAISLGGSWVQSMLQNYREPERRGTPKGDPIGFSLKKQKAALLTILDPTLQVKEIAKLCAVPVDTLGVWRARDFKTTAKEACKSFGEQISNTIRNEVEEIKDPEKLKPYFQLTGTGSYSHITLILTLPFFHPEVSVPFLNFANERVAKGDVRYLHLMLEFTEAAALYRDKNLEGWVKSPIFATSIKYQVTVLCTLLLALLSSKSPERLSPEGSIKIVRGLQDLLFQEIDLLSGTTI